MTDLIGGDLGLWLSAVTCTVAAVFGAWGAMAGIWQHRLPRLLLATATAVIATSYWVDIVGGGPAVDMRRGAGWVLWPALAWTAWSGIRYSRRVVAATDQLTAARPDP